MWRAGAAALLLVLALLLLRNSSRRRRPLDRSATPTLRTMVVLGSGGHTAEMFALLESLELRRYTPRCYVVAATDTGSAAKAHAFEALASARLGGDSPACQYEVCVIRRSREVGQSYRSSVRTTLLALSDASALVWRRRPQLLLCNGPGTCLPLVLAAAVLRVAVRRGCVLVYLESICRVQKLSLTGALLYHLQLADALYVQWEGLRRLHPRARYLGHLL